jgi:hypothetical protein
MEQISLVTFSNLSDEEPDDATTVPAEPADAANNAKTSPDEKVASEHLMVTCIIPSFFKQYSRTLSYKLNFRLFQTSVLKNVYWKEFGLLAFVWMAFLALQIAKVRDFKL